MIGRLHGKERTFEKCVSAKEVIEVIICKVIGNVWATKKAPHLEGYKYMIVESVYTENHEKSVAIDCVGAGVGEYVFVSFGKAARIASGNADSPVDAAIIGIIDKACVSKELQ